MSLGQRGTRGWMRTESWCVTCRICTRNTTAVGTTTEDPHGRRKSRSRTHGEQSCLWRGSIPVRLTVSRCGASTQNCNQSGGSTDDTSHPVFPIVCCRAASRDLSLPQRRRCHTKGTRQHSQSRCSGRPGTGRSAEDVSPRSGSFPRHMFQVLLMAKAYDGRRREG